MSKRLCQGGAVVFFLCLLLSVGWLSSTRVDAASVRLTLNVPAITTTAGVPWSGTIATGSDSLAGDTLTSTIEWGDGSQSHPTVKLAKNGTFQIHTSHTFTIAGNFRFAVSVTSATGSGIANTAALTVTIPKFTLNVSAISATVGVPWSGTIATGSDSLAGDTLTSTIEWGDGSQSHPTVLLAKNGTFQIHTSHTFTIAGNFRLGVSVTSVTTGSGIANTAALTVTTAKPLKLGKPCLFIRNKSAFLVVTFSDSEQHTRPADYSATINWGDSTTSKGTIWNNWSARDFLLLGQHHYHHHGKYSITLAITGPGGNSITKTLTTVV